MSFPQNLFVETPGMQEVSMHQLGEDFEAWPEELIQKLKENIPQITGSYATLVKFMKKDEESGAATGSILVSNNKKQAIVPVIIKDFMLYPLDVFIVDKKLLPLTPDYFDAAFMNNNVFQKLEEYPMYGGLGRFEDANLWNAVYPPSLGRYAYASGSYTLLDAIADTIDTTEFKKHLNENPWTAVEFQKHGHADLIKKLAAIKSVDMDGFRKGADALINRDIVLHTKTAILKNSSCLFAPSVEAPDLNDVKHNGETFKKIPKSTATVLVEDPTNKSSLAKAASEYGTYSVLDKNGTEFLGTVIPKMVDFDMNVVPEKLFISEKTAAMQPEFVGIKKEAHKVTPVKIVSPGDWGCFVFEKGGKAVATIPVMLKVAYRDEANQDFLKVEDLTGRNYFVKVACDGNLNRIAKVAGSYIMPQGFSWQSLPGFGTQELVSTTRQFLDKTAAKYQTANPSTVIYKDQNSYALRGPIAKYAGVAGWDATHVDEAQTKFLLISLGANLEKTALALKTAHIFGHATVHGLNNPPTKQEKLAAAVPVAEKMLKQANNIKCNLINEAALLAKAANYVENSQTIDTLLSLNFVNPDNISKFVGKLPGLKATISSLASLLIASRLGIKEIPEHAASTAMFRLIEVVNGLEALRAVQETGAGQ